MARSRKRGSGQKEHQSIHFAMIPEQVAASEAFCSLTASAHRLLVLALCQVRKGNNGNIAITRARFKAHRFSNVDTFTRALKELQDHGLIRRTRQGEMSQGAPKPSLYAFTWMPVLDQPKVGVEASEPTNEWLDFDAPRKHRKDSKPPPPPKKRRTDTSVREDASEAGGAENRRTDISERPRTDISEGPDPIFRNPDDSRTDISDRARTDISDTFLRSSPEGHPPPHEVQVSGDLLPSSRIDSAPGQGTPPRDPGESQVDGTRDKRGPLSLANRAKAPVIPIRKK